MTQASQPILADVDPSAPFAWHHGRAISRAALLRDAEKLADQLPPCTHVANYCRQRYPFAVAFLASMLRERVTLLPHDGTVRTLDLLRRRYPTVCNVTDDPSRAAEVDTVVVDAHGDDDGATVRAPSLPSDRIVAVMFTSGTTGEPTPHDKTLRALHACAQLYVEELDLPANGGSVIATVPPQHMYGFESSILVPLLHRMVVDSGHPLYSHDVRTSLRDVPPPRVLVTTPLHLRALVGSQDALPRTEIIISAAAPLAEPLARQVEARFGARVMEVYGCTEAGIVATRRPATGDAWTLPTAITMTVDGEHAWIGSEHTGRVRLNDLVEPLSPGRFRLLGRGADLVNIAGKRASLAGLDSILLEIDGVVDGGFFLSDADHDESERRLSAVVVAPRLTAIDIKRELRSRVDAAFVPRDVHLVSVLPRDRTGKLARTTLAEIARDQRSCARDT